MHPSPPGHTGSPPSYRVVGKSLPRFDVADKVRGTTLYAADWQLPGMLAGRILRAIYPSARIRRVDVEMARALPGVAAVSTAADIPRNAVHEDPTGSPWYLTRPSARIGVSKEVRPRPVGSS